MKKTMGASAAILGSAAVLSALTLFTGPGAATASPTAGTAAGTAATPASTTPAQTQSSEVDPNERGYAYVQQGDSVTVYRQNGGEVVARLTLTSVTYGRTRGHLALKVTAEKAFRLPAKQLIWEDEEGADTAPVDSGRVVRVAAGTTRNVRIDFRNVGSGAIVWATGTDSVGGVWTVADSGDPVTAAGKPRLAYIQRGDTVTAYRGAKVAARLRPTSATFGDGEGQLVLRVVAKQAFRFPAKQFIWEDEDGADTAPVDTDRVVRVAAGTTKDVQINFRGVGAGTILWATGSDTVVGAWAVTGR
jgi:hypothetical protein